MASKKDNYINRDFSHDRDRFDSNITLLARAMIIADEIAKGTLYRLIVKKYMDEWDVSYNYMHSIITESINMFNNEAIYKKLKDINLDRLTDIYAEARLQGDLDVAIKAVDKLNKTAGIYDTEKTLVQVLTDDSNIVITFGGETVESVEAKFNLKPDEAPFNEVGSLINEALDKKETKQLMNIQLPKMFGWQLKVFLGLKNHWKDSIHVVKSRRQCGKSILAELIGMYYCILNKNFRCYIIEPTFNQADKVLTETWKMCKGQPFYYKKNNIKRLLLFKNGAEIRLFSAEQGVDALQGYTCELLIIDEAAYLSEDIIDAIFPYVNTTKGPIVMFSTPRTKSGQFYNYYLMGMSGDENIYSYDWANYDVSELLSPAKLELYRKTVDPLKFKNYYLGEFLNNESDFFGDYSQCVKDKPSICMEPVVFGIDWAGATGGDYTAISIIGMSGQLYNIIYFNDKDPKQTIAEILRLVTLYKPKKVTVETNSIGNVYFGLLRDELKMRNVPLIGFYTDNNSKDKIISKLQVAFQNNKIMIYTDYELMDELQYYELTYSKTLKRVFNAKAGHHDDLIMSLAIGFNSLTAGNYDIC